MKSLFKRSMITAVVLGGVLAAAATPAAAIVGGQDATRVYPGMTFVSALYPGIGSAKCGGTLIHPLYVLTASHCVSDQFVAPAVAAVPAERVTVRIGSNDRTTGGVEAVGAQVMLHPDWQWGMPTGLPISDLALVKLTRPVPSRLMPVGLRQVRPSQPLRLIGWGLTAFPVPPGSPLPTMLQQRDTTVLPAAACAGGGIDAGETCTSPGACFGDSGGPALRANYAGRHSWWTEVGLASRETSDPQDPEANPCSEPIIYTNTTYGPFRQWIRDTTRTGHTRPCTCGPTTVRSLDTATRNRISQLKPLITP